MLRLRLRCVVKGCGRKELEGEGLCGDHMKERYESFWFGKNMKTLVLDNTSHSEYNYKRD